MMGVIPGCGKDNNHKINFIVWHSNQFVACVLPSSGESVLLVCRVPVVRLKACEQGCQIRNGGGEKAFLDNVGLLQRHAHRVVLSHAI